jgi:hypothetical protein
MRATRFLKRIAARTQNPRRDECSRSVATTYAAAETFWLVGTDAIVFRICEAIW